MRQTDVLTILPGTLPVPELARRLADTDGAIIMKLGRTFPDVVRALRQPGRLEHACTSSAPRCRASAGSPVADVDPATVPYFSLIVVPGDSVAADRRRAPHRAGRVPAERASVSRPDDCGTPRPRPRPRPRRVAHARGLGRPRRGRPRRRLCALRQPRPAARGLTRHASGNTVEVDRARLALDLANTGERVAVVSGGDAGVFGMAGAVFEAAADYPGVPIGVLPGVSAVQRGRLRKAAPRSARTSRCCR